MQSVSSTWEGLLAADAEREVRFTINGVTYGHDRIVSARKLRREMETLSIGEACAASLELSFFPVGHIPPAAEIRCEVRLREGGDNLYIGDENGNIIQTSDGFLLAAKYAKGILISDENGNLISTADGYLLAGKRKPRSEWIPRGTFYIDTRYIDETTGLMTVTAYDRMLFAEAPYIDQEGTYPMPMEDAVDFIAADLGVEVDERNEIYTGMIDCPNHVYNEREVLRFIAAASGGNFIISDEGKLRLVPVASPAEDAPEQPCSKCLPIGDAVTITGVRLLPDEDTEYFAGDSNGYIISGECAYATQEMCNAVLSCLSGVVYRPVEARGVLLNPALEIGDSVNLGGIVTVIAQDDVTCGAAMVSDVVAPIEEELEHEIPYQSRSREQRMTATSFSEIRKSTSEIALYVQSVDGKVGALTVKAGEIEQKVEGKVNGEQASSMIKTALNGITLSATSGTNTCTIILTGEGLDAKEVVAQFKKIVADEVSADNITGSLTSDQIDLYGDLTVWRDEDLDSTGGYMGYTTSTKDGSAGMHMESRYGSGEVRVTENGVAMEHDDGGSVVCTNNTSINGDYVFVDSAWETFVFSEAFYSENAAYLGIYGNEWEAVYANTGTIQTSDERKKTDIVRDVSKYRAFLLDLIPSCGKYIDGTSDRTHIFFVAQDVEKMMTKHGLTDLDFAGLIKSPVRDKLTGEVIDYMYALRYAEFIPLILDAVQQQEQRLQAVEKALGLR